MNITYLKANRHKWEYKLAAFEDKLRGRGLPSTDNQMRKIWREAFVRMREQFNAERLRQALEEVSIIFDGDAQEITDTVENNIRIAVDNASVPQFNLTDARSLNPIYAKAINEGKNVGRRRVREQIEENRIVERQATDAATRAAILAMLARELHITPANRRLAQQRMMLTINRSNAATRRRIAEIIKIAYREGESFVVVEQIINAQLTKWGSYRARTLGRTETETMAIFGISAAYAAFSIPASTWECGLDPCPICLPNCGQEQTLGLPYASGDAEPPAHPNCVCTLIPVVTPRSMLAMGVAANAGFQLI